jgi:tripartite-type tricarboxylate transporter receptor subunit TctC
VPFSPGGAVDGPMRAIAEQLGKRLKQQVIIENKPGAGATIGSESVAKSPPDGYTLLLASQTNAISASLYPRLSFQPIDDFVGISLLGREPGVLVVHPSLPVKSVAELVALARQKPGELNYASSGNGSGQHLFMAMFASMAGVKLTHVPYKGTTQATLDVMSGQIPMMFSGTNAVVNQVREGKLNGLAVGGATRSPLLPAVPTVAESGLPGYEFVTWMGMFAPLNTPKEIIARVNAELVRALGAPELRERLIAQGVEVKTSTPEQLGELTRSRLAQMGKIIQDAGIHIE